jgi:DNA-binding NarL/FixJ family response regulator
VSGRAVWGDVSARATVTLMTASVLAFPSLGSTEGSPVTLPSSCVDERGAGTIRVAIAHGECLVRAGLRVLLEREPGMCVVDEAADGDDAVAVARRLRPDVVLLDVRLPGLDCVEATRRIVARPGVAVMVLSPSETDARVFASLRAGAAGLLLEDRDPAALARAVRLLGRGGRPHARRNRRIQPAREVPMLTPKVTEITRGSAHVRKAGQVNGGSNRAS